MFLFYRTYLQSAVAKGDLWAVEELLDESRVDIDHVDKMRMTARMIAKRRPIAKAIEDEIRKREDQKRKLRLKQIKSAKPKTEARAKRAAKPAKEKTVQEPKRARRPKMPSFSTQKKT